ncbi:MAG: polyprenyl synthetase family protein [Planctomycetes bacterium]|nr:polyprenyl synthetase family protein [Planctomycetota bacterium]
MPTIVERLRAFATTFDARLAGYLATAPDVPDELAAAVRYSALAPGKRIRPYLVIRCAELAGGTADQALPAAIAVECVHAFSLIHDDLPAMDDDDLRRGLPACHKQFGEAIAILAGDALVMLAFESLAKHVPGEAAAAMVRELAVGAGWAGMIGGQTADVQSEGGPPSVELARFIHERKTASLIRTACRLGALSVGADPDMVEALGDFGQSLGQAFQIADDLLDVTASAEVLGKGVRKDSTVGKQSFPRCVGIKGSQAAAREAMEVAIGALEPFGGAANDLRELAQYVVSRDY